MPTTRSLTVGPARWAHVAHAGERRRDLRRGERLRGDEGTDPDVQSVGQALTDGDLVHRARVGPATGDQAVAVDPAAELRVGGGADPLEIGRRRDDQPVRGEDRDRRHAREPPQARHLLSGRRRRELEVGGTARRLEPRQRGARPTGAGHGREHARTDHADEDHEEHDPAPATPEVPACHQRERSAHCHIRPRSRAHGKVGRPTGAGVVAPSAAPRSRRGPLPGPGCSSRSPNSIERVRSRDQVLVFDADDTLWENNHLFDRVIDDYLEWLAHPTMTRAEIRAVLLDIEAANAATHGYGSEVFLRSLRDCFRHLNERPATDGRARRHRHAGPAPPRTPRRTRARRRRDPRRARVPSPAAAADQGRHRGAAAEDRRLGAGPPLRAHPHRRGEGRRHLPVVAAVRRARPGDELDDRQLAALRHRARAGRRHAARCTSRTRTRGRSSRPSSIPTTTGILRLAHVRRAAGALLTGAAGAAAVSAVSVDVVADGAARCRPTAAACAPARARRSARARAGARCAPRRRWSGRRR